MTPYEIIEQEVLNLPLEEKEILVQTLLGDLRTKKEEKQEEIEKKWEQEIERRVENVLSGKAELYNMDDISQEIREKYS